MLSGASEDSDEIRESDALQTSLPKRDNDDRIDRGIKI
jgi:hypothetical protein